MSSEKTVLSLQALRHVAVDDALRKAFDHGGLAHAGFADEHGIVLGAARKDAG
jgi:tRNA(Ile2) C34 agmatinyltransferase TiaS